MDYEIMKLSREEVQHIALLARIGLDSEEIEKFRHQLSDILDNFEILQEVDTSTLSPTAQAIDLRNVMREDETIPSIPPAEILANAPQREDDYFRVQAVLE